ncbi:hypothetical protein PR048_029957 [Dryococelus australis]|uniref:Uncharacterized protein n=1 Tax=Dryococelus australis TaxID=614101 RepID=A0ABQ9GBJ8_9NEOP|nr:hypothetical protein PR048_029957 [Dryococelus australis]
MCLSGSRRGGLSEMQQASGPVASHRIAASSARTGIWYGRRLRTVQPRQTPTLRDSGLWYVNMCPQAQLVSSPSAASGHLVKVPITAWNVGPGRTNGPKSSSPILYITLLLAPLRLPYPCQATPRRTPGRALHRTPSYDVVWCTPGVMRTSLGPCTNKTVRDRMWYTSPATSHFFFGLRPYRISRPWWDDRKCVILEWMSFFYLECLGYWGGALAAIFVVLQVSILCETMEQTSKQCPKIVFFTDRTAVAEGYIVAALRELPKYTEDERWKSETGQLCTSDENIARHFRHLGIETMAHLMHVAVSPFPLSLLSCKLFRWFQQLTRLLSSPVVSLPPGFRKWGSCRTMPLVGGFSRGSSVSPALSFRRHFMFTSVTLIGSQDIAVKSRSNLFILTHSLDCCFYIDRLDGLWLKISGRCRVSRAQVNDQRSYSYLWRFDIRHLFLPFPVRVYLEVMAHSHELLPRQSDMEFLFACRISVSSFAPLPSAFGKVEWFVSGTLLTAAESLRHYQQPAARQYIITPEGSVFEGKEFIHVKEFSVDSAVVETTLVAWHREKCGNIRNVAEVHCPISSITENEDTIGLKLHAGRPIVLTDSEESMVVRQIKNP